MRESKLRDDGMEAARRAAEAAKGVKRKSVVVEGQRVIQARLRDDSGGLIDRSLAEGVEGLKYWPEEFAAKGEGGGGEMRYVVVIVATADADMLVEVVAHPLESKYLSSSSSSSNPSAIIASYASAAAAPAPPELKKQMETPCLKLAAFVATHCQVWWW